MQYLKVDEEQEYLNGRHTIKREKYMGGDLDLITGEKLLKSGKQITITSSSIGTLPRTPTRLR